MPKPRKPSPERWPPHAQHTPSQAAWPRPSAEAARALGLHHVDARLAVRTAQDWMGQGRTAEARDLLKAVHRPASTNPAHKAVEQALARIDAETARALAIAERAAGHTPDPDRSRPAGRTRPNPYRVAGG